MTRGVDYEQARKAIAPGPQAVRMAPRADKLYASVMSEKVATAETGTRSSLNNPWTICSDISLGNLTTGYFTLELA